MRLAGVLIVLVAGTAVPSLAQAAPCRQTVATLTVPSSTYAEVGAKEFAGRVFVFVPEVGLTAPGRFRPFQLWIIEGVYARPFMQSRGSLAQSTFDALSKSRNIRATPVSVTRGDGSDAGAFRVRGTQYPVRVLGVAVSKGVSVDLAVCR
jgi:hypothetical protein